MTDTLSHAKVHSRLATMPVSSLKGVGPKMVEKLHKIHIYSIQDILLHLPLRYEDRTRVYAVADVLTQQYATLVLTIQSSQVVFGKRRMLTVSAYDASGRITLRFFNFNAGQKNALAEGRQIKCFGEVRRGAKGLEMAHPEYQFLGEEQPAAVEESLTPVYPTTEGLRQATLRNLTDQALALLQQNLLHELLPEEFRPQHWTISDAFLYVHRPPADASLELLSKGSHPAQRRLIIEELIAQNLGMLLVRSQSQVQKAVALTPDDALIQKFLANLPFEPTGAQKRVVKEIEADLKKPEPMMRLVQGDVGSGKTLVAALAALISLGRGYQVALMAPTELLAEQHANNLSHWFAPLGFDVAWLAGKVKGKARKNILASIASGESQLIVGTHALFQQQVEFHNLCLVIIDEQHRFGVHQRLELREKGAHNQHYPHQLVMTATPIPRTLAMTMYADLDVSVIDELPPGRTPITTVAIPDLRRDSIIQRVQESCLNDKRQVYWVCTLIEESETLQCQAAEDTAEQLQHSLPDLKIGLVHGRMKPQEKQHAMEAFKNHETDLLVATTVIEVGVDVPNASLMIIENPERLGLAQLHQLRGRVGRGTVESHCVLLYLAPLSRTAQKRLNVLRESTNGFVIAEKDLEIRGPGDFLGTKQTGLASLKIADLIRDAELIPQVQETAQMLWLKHQDIAQQLITRWLPNKDVYRNA